ncbi:MAG: pyruvate kinase [Pseudomonadota bacterium]
MTLPPNKTKIVCTIGPASESPEILERMIHAGMNIARINFSHGDFAGHGRVIKAVRSAALAVGRQITIMADLPGPKMRIGKLLDEPIELERDAVFSITTADVLGTDKLVSVSFKSLPEVVNPGDTLFLNDGLIQLEVTGVEKEMVHCRVIVGGELRSRKGLNLPGIDLGISAFTEQDKECLKFALDQGVEAVSESFVQSSEDIAAVREAAADEGHTPFVIAKIERSVALNHLDTLLEAADGVMIARGDLGVETPIERIALIQKQLMRKANLLGKPVITATQMLESMVNQPRPTRAESTDVANAILDGTDCVMLSEESAMGKYPVDAVAMLRKIAVSVETSLTASPLHETLKSCVPAQYLSLSDLITLSVAAVVERVEPAAVFVPTRTGSAARSIARFRLPVWVVAVSRHESTCKGLPFSYGVHPVHVTQHPDDWNRFVKDWLREHEIHGNLAVLTEGPSAKHPDANHRMEIIDLKRAG